MCNFALPRTIMAREVWQWCARCWNPANSITDNCVWLRNLIQHVPNSLASRFESQMQSPETQPSHHIGPSAETRHLVTVSVILGVDIYGWHTRCRRDAETSVISVRVTLRP